MGQGFQVDVVNLCGQAVIVSASPTPSIAAGSIPQTTLQDGQSLSGVLPQQAPVYFELSSSKLGMVYLAVAPASAPNNSTHWQLFLDPTSVANGTPSWLPGFVFMTSSPIVFPPLVMPGGGYVYPSISLSQWGQWTKAEVVLFSAANSVDYLAGVTNGNGIPS